MTILEDPPFDSRMDFGLALRKMKEGAKVSRKGWNGKGMWLCYVPGVLGAGADEVPVQFKPEVIQRGNAGIEVLPFIAMRTADGKLLLGWLASQTDMLADDWGVVE